MADQHAFEPLDLGAQGDERPVAPQPRKERRPRVGSLAVGVLFILTGISGFTIDDATEIDVVVDLDPDAGSTDD